MGYWRRRRRVSDRVLFWFGVFGFRNEIRLECLSDLVGLDLSLCLCSRRNWFLDFLSLKIAIFGLSDLGLLVTKRRNESVSECLKVE